MHSRSSRRSGLNSHNNITLILSSNLNTILSARTTCLERFLPMVQFQYHLTSISNMTTGLKHLCLLSSSTTKTTPSNQTLASSHSHSPRSTRSKLMKDSHATQ